MKKSFRTIQLVFLAVVLLLSGAAYALQESTATSIVCKVAPRLESNLERVPHGAIWQKESIFVPTPPEAFSSVVGWINVVSALPCMPGKVPAVIEIRSMKLIERDKSGSETVIKDIQFVSEMEAAKAVESGLFPRVPTWFGETEGSTDMAIDMIQDGAWRIDPGQASLRVYHAWTAPRSAARPGAHYFVEVETKIHGAARLELGIDYWRDAAAPYNGYDKSCQKNNCEAWVSDWYGDTKGQFVTIRAPKSF